jgi:hypothetical protein
MPEQPEQERRERKSSEAHAKASKLDWFALKPFHLAQNLLAAGGQLASWPCDFGLIVTHPVLVPCS